MNKHILVVEDESIIRHTIKRLLERNGYQVSDVASLDAAKKLNLKKYQLIITDLRLPGGEGTELIELAKHIPVVVMTSYASMRSAVDTMKLGAIDYIAKPFNHEELLTVISNIFEKKILQKKVDLSKKEVKETSNIIGKHESIRRVFNIINKVAPTDSTVLIQGESGTGKELVAKDLHSKSARKDEALISVNCAAIPESLIESELFGYEKGAFTGADSQRKGLIEAADNGTLFLDEIGELPLSAQARLLRVLQEKEIRRIGSTKNKKINVRIIAATHRDLKQLSSENLFRADLYYRLNVILIELPPLRARGQDVIDIAQILLQSKCQMIGQPIAKFTEEALMSILKNPWLGNVRELENSIERAVVLCTDNTITSTDLNITSIKESNSL
jgi:two-component system response regulator HydG